MATKDGGGSRRKGLPKGSKYEFLLNGSAENPTRLIKALKLESPSVIDGFFERANKDAMDQLLAEPSTGRSYDNVLVPLVALLTKSVEHELKWLTLSLERNLADLAGHIRLNNNWLKFILTGSYESASDILDRIERLHGVSIWTINARLITAQRRDELTANRELLAEICGKLAYSSIRTIAEFASQRAESRAAYSTYVDDVDRTLHPLTEPKYAGLVNWWRFNAAPFATRRTELDNELVWRQGLLPNVDRYVGIVRVLQSRVDDSLMTPSLMSAVRRIANALEGVDPQLSRLLLARDAGSPLSPAANDGVDIPGLIDRYTRGHYAEVGIAAQTSLIENPDVFELYELLSSSVVLGGLPVPAPFAERSLGNDLLEAMVACTKRDGGIRPIEFLQRIATQLYGTRFGAQVWGFAATQPQGPKGRNDRALESLCCTVVTPRFAFLYSDRKTATAFLGRLEEADGGPTPTSGLYRAILDCDTSQIPPTIPAARRHKYAGRGFLEVGRYKEALEEFSALARTANPAVPVVEAAAVGTLAAALGLGDLDKAAEAVVTTYLHSPSLINSMDLIAVARKAISESPKASILWPIFWVVIDHSVRDPSKVGATVDLKQIACNALEDFLISKGARFPSELLTHSAEFDHDLLVALLSMVCTTDVMDYSPEFDGENDLEQERVALCEALLALDPRRASAYKSEIAELLRSVELRRTLREIDLTKIHVDIQGIVDSLGQPFEERYRRYREYSALSEKLRTSHFAREADEDDLKIVRDVIDLIKKMGNAAQYQDIGYRQAWELFQELLTRFISSEFGLDSYLSARIRHGVLAGQLRSAFEERRLITQRSSHSSEYASNTHWVDWATEHYGAEIAARIDRHLKALSRAVDTSIERVKRDKIQIKSKIDDSGLFNFVYSVEFEGDRIWDAARNTKTYYEFLGAMLRELMERLGVSLNSISSYVRGDLATEFTRVLEEVSLSISAEHPNLSHSPLVNAIRQCGTMLHNNLATVAGWFVPVGGASAFNIDMAVLSDTVVATVRRMNPTYQVTVGNDVPTNAVLIGGMLSSVFDLLLILLDNAVRHCSSTQVEATVLAKVEDGRLRLEVGNTFQGDATLAEEAARNLSDPNFTWQNSGAVRQEGKSGFYKLHKIVRYDLRQGNAYTIAAHVERDGMQQRFVVAVELNAAAVLA